MRYDVLTLFPDMFESVFRESIVRRAIDAGRVEIHVHNIRDWATDKHHITDDLPYGGGGGMVMKPEPIVRAVEELLGADLVAEQRATGRVQVPVIMLTPAGRTFRQAVAHEYGRYERLLLICGRYEGIDERVSDLVATDQFSRAIMPVGAIVDGVIEAVTRLCRAFWGTRPSSRSHARGLRNTRSTRGPPSSGFRCPMCSSGNHALVAH